jgi:sulfotransferase 6B1
VPCGSRSGRHRLGNEFAPLWVHGYNEGRQRGEIVGHLSARVTPLWCTDPTQPPLSYCETVRITDVLARRRWTLERFGFTPRKVVARMRNRTEPMILCVSLPKAGTHLLERALCLHPRLYRRLVPTLSEANLNRGRRFDALLDSLRPGQVVLCHLAFTPEYRRWVTERHIKCLFLIRDPRDIVVSQSYYIAGKRDHPLHELFANVPDLKERLKIAIQGDLPHGLESVGQRLAQFAGWLDASDLVIRFEDLVDSEGGGDQGVQLATLRALYRSIGLFPDDQFFADLVRQLVSSVSPTFRTGKTGGWRAHFDPELEALFRAVAGTQLAPYGYE